MESLVSSLSNPARPSFLFGVTPPREGTAPGKCREICNKFVARQRGLATDGFIVYDIQDESSRNGSPRPFAFRRLLDPSWYASLFESESGKECLIYKCTPTTESEEHFLSWMNAAHDLHRHRAFNLVGAASSSQDYRGPSVEEAAVLLRDHYGGKGCRFGCVAIAERHAARHREHENMLRTVRGGAEWFVSQGIYDADAMVELINDYGALCRSEGVVPRKVLLTFVPCGREKTLQFIEWLGMQVPQHAKERIFKAREDPRSSFVEESCQLNRENLVKILEGTSGCGVPLGLNVESVSGYRDEIDATHHLFRDLQAILLDHRGSPWMVRWYDVPRGGEGAARARKDSEDEQARLVEHLLARVHERSSEGSASSLAAQEQVQEQVQDVQLLVRRMSQQTSSPTVLLTMGAGIMAAGVSVGYALGRGR